ncbi:putative MFS family arabinose efflux permease [Herbaspirillum sp. Sphag1AN]|uniref:YbfB/YjiJ family MFS transporter n=1 Tax=unclassified Herbaspirillum TaxID=2624150 RepID=UPI0016102929|nr:MULTISPECIES: YbfB/YjiJ family MFS transporter [unclassified Herbaspirillum]MBB3213624.1 putative MFS family arabinose efflux permease [Herbaspirillum sp. Sphag1AN]MBB3246822.1 putative MFS family arabinose efflux permease [Herbaspirillum sp. Sphag64]
MSGNSASHKPPHSCSVLLTAIALSLGSAVALGMARFSYALLLTPMRTDLGWPYLIAGGMNTGNALGYLIGALLTPPLARRMAASTLLIAGALATSLLVLSSGLFIDTTVLLLLRVASGISSAFVFVCGGILITRLATLHPQRAGFLLGLFYGGTGIGIVISAWLVPLTISLAQTHGVAHHWQWAWLAMGVLSLLATACLAPAARNISSAPAQSRAEGHFRWSTLGIGLGAYFLFGLGYIGYMTFVIALLKEQGMSPLMINWFYTALGLAVMVASRLWAGMLDRFKGGQALAILNGLLSIATLLPALTAAPLVVFASGVLFGGVFLSAVASTTALVRHNLPAASWPAGISAFTIVFALGQIIGPSMVGWIADHLGGLQQGLQCSALALLAGALLAWRQQPLPPGAVTATMPR